MERLVCEQAALGRAERDGEVGHHAVLGRLPGLAIKPGGQIDRDHEGAGCGAQGVERAAGGENRLAQRQPRPEPEQAIEDHHRSADARARGIRQQLPAREIA